MSVVFASVALAYLVFTVFGDESGAGSMTAVRVSLLIFIPFFTYIQPVNTLANVRREFLRGVWEWKSAERAVEPDGIINPWRRIGVLPLACGSAVAVVMYFALPRFLSGPLSQMTINLLAIIPTAALSSVFIWLKLYRDRVSFSAALEKPLPEAPEPFGRYFFLEHAGPWAPLQAVINAGIGVRIFMFEAAKAGAGEGIAASVLAADTFIMGWILIFFMWFGSQNQVRADVQLGRVAKDGRKGMAVPLMLFFFILPAAIMAAVAGGIVLATGPVSVAAATAVKTIVAMVSAVAGCRLGVWWGARRETRIINETSSGRES